VDEAEAQYWVETMYEPDRVWVIEDVTYYSIR
jgi:hypothetical protein